MTTDLKKLDFAKIQSVAQWLKEHSAVSAEVAMIGCGNVTVFADGGFSLKQGEKFCAMRSNKASGRKINGWLEMFWLNSDQTFVSIPDASRSISLK